MEAVPASDPARGVKPLGPSDPPTIGSYQLLGVLGSGGMGRVYLGQSRTGRRVAIKVIRPDLADDAVFRDRFTREVAAARLVSPLFTAAVVDADTGAAAPWLATTYIDGIGLDRRVLDRGPMAADEVLSLAAGLGEALSSIHDAGLVHRDLKPSNILLNAGGPHIIDFGLALGTEQSRLTTSLVVGTPSYMAPERLRGDDAGPPSDIFSLGATLVFAATGRDLVDDATVYQQVLQIAEGRFNLADVPPRLRAVIVRCVSFEPRDRPTAAELTRFVVALGAARPTGETTGVAAAGAAGPAGDGAGGHFAPPVQPKASPDSPPFRPKAPVRTPLVVRPHTTPPDPGRWPGPATDLDHAITPSGVPVAPVDGPSRWSRRRLLVGGGVLGTAVAVGAIVMAADALAHQQTGSGVATGAPSPASGAGGPTGSPSATRPGASTGGRIVGRAHSGARPPMPPPTSGAAGRTALVTPAGLLVSVSAEGITATPVRGTGGGWTFPTRAGTGAVIWRWGGDILVVDGTSLTLLDAGTGKLVRTVVPARMLPAGALPARHPSLILGLGVAVDESRAYIGLGAVTIAVDRELTVRWARRMDGLPAGGLFEVPTAAGGGFLVTQLATPLFNAVRLRSAATGEPIWDSGFTAGGLDVTAPPGLGLPNRPADPATAIAEARVTAEFVAVRFGAELRVYRTASSTAFMRRHGPSPISAIEVIGDSLVVASGELSLYDLTTGSARWQHGGGGGRIGVASSPARIVVADSQNITGIDPENGDPLWQVPLPPGTYGAGPIEVTTGPHTAYITYGPRPDGQMPADDVIAVAF